VLLGGLLALAPGCSAGRGQVQRALLSDRNPASHARDLEALYPVRCPDVLDVQVAGRPGWSGRRPVGPDGRVTLGDGCQVRVDGQPTPEIARAVARSAAVAPEAVTVRVADYRSQQLYLFGEVSGLQRVLPYRGPETVLDLLQRAGGVTPGASLGEVRVVRTHVADGKPPEVFEVDLPAILLRRDQQTNVVLQPSDQIHVGESRRSHRNGCLPPWLRPLHERLCGLRQGR
jgi:protein involved in polysaccharide export with SLBB domain